MSPRTQGVLHSGGLAIVAGATGGIGGAFTDALSGLSANLKAYALSRTRPASLPGGVSWGHIDTAREETVMAAADSVKAAGAPVRLVIVATGLLHKGDDVRPEKTWAAQAGDAFETVFRANTIGPALVAKHFLPLLDKTQPSVFAVLSARVGSISDNRLGGWHAYRASKAAVNMLIKNYAIELARRNPSGICIGLHPGTVDTGLSKPFQAHVKPGALFSPAEAAAHMLGVIDRATPDRSGQVLAWDGEQVPA